MAPKKRGRKLPPIPVLSPEVVQVMATNKTRRERRLRERRIARADKRNPPLLVTEADVPPGSLLSAKMLVLIRSGGMKVRRNPPTRPKGPRYDREQKELDRLAAQYGQIAPVPKSRSQLAQDLEFVMSRD